MMLMAFVSCTYAAAPHHCTSLSQPQPSAIIDHLEDGNVTTGGDGTAAQWAWEADGGPGSTNPFQKGWAAVGWDSD